MAINWGGMLPIERVKLCAGGTASYPSSLIMATLAKVAGLAEIIICLTK